MLLVGVSLALADVLLWALIGFECATFENLEGARARLCNHNDPQTRLWLPVLGALIVLVSIYAARRAHRGWVFALGAFIAAGTGGYILVITLG
jgi:hypothetical protein